MFKVILYTHIPYINKFVMCAKKTRHTISILWSAFFSGKRTFNKTILQAP